MKGWVLISTIYTPLSHLIISVSQIKNEISPSNMIYSAVFAIIIEIRQYFYSEILDEGGGRSNKDLWVVGWCYKPADTKFIKCKTN